MKHFLLFLYFLSYTSGIGAIALAGFYYLKTKLISVKYIILADLFFTLYLFFDTVNFYTDLFIIKFPIWLQYVKILGLLFSSIGLIYFFMLSAYTVMGIEITERKRILYFATSFTVLFICLISISLLYRTTLLSENQALHSGFFLSNIFTSIGCVYNILLIINNKEKLNSNLKQFAMVIVLLTLVITPISILSNVVQYWNVFRIPVAYSPIGYFLLNLTGIIFAAKYLLTEEKSTEITITKDSLTIENHSTSPSFEESIKEYKLTERELEIVQLVVKGCTNQEIGDKLFISPNTARNHIYNIYKKMGIKNRYALLNIISLNKNNVEL